MSRSLVQALAVVAVACAAGACATVAGLDQYENCAHDCPEGGAADAISNSGGRDATPDAATRDAAMVDAAADRETVDDDAPSSDDATLDAASDATGVDVSAADGHVADASADVGATEAAAPDSGDAGPGDSGPKCAAITDLEGGALLAYYPFEGNTADQSGNGHTATATTGTDVTYTTGKLGEGVTIVTGGQGVKVTGSTQVSGPKSLCAWVNAATAATGQAMPVFVGGAGAAVNYYDLEPAMSPSAGGCTVTANSLFMDNGACSTSTVTAAPGSWSFVCFAYSGSSTTFFSNGSTHMVSGGQYDPFTLAQITVGSDLIGGSTTQALFDGLMDEVSIWSGTLSTSDMNSLYNQGNGCRIR